MTIKGELIEFVFNTEDVNEQINKYLNGKCGLFFGVKREEQMEYRFIDGRMYDEELRPFKSKEQILGFIDEMYAQYTVLQMINNNFDVDKGVVGKVLLNNIPAPVISFKEHVDFIRFLIERNRGEMVSKVAKKNELKFKYKKDLDFLKDKVDGE